jgi:hypothetical protein
MKADLQSCCHRIKKIKDRRKIQPIFTGWGRSQLRHMPIPQNFVAFHGMGVRRYMNGRVASFLIG